MTLLQLLTETQYQKLLDWFVEQYNKGCSYNAIYNSFCSGEDGLGYKVHSKLEAISKLDLMMELYFESEVWDNDNSSLNSTIEFAKWKAI